MRAKKRVALELFDREKHLKGLYELLVYFQIEVFDEDTDIDLETFINYHNAGIYIVVSEDGEAVGFTALMKSNYFGLRPPVICNTYLYIHPKYRRTRAMHLMSIQAGKVAIAHGCGLEHYYVAESGSIPFTGRMEGKHLYDAYEYPVEVIKDQVNKLCNRVKIKG